MSAGGRVLGVTAQGKDLREAQANAYVAVKYRGWWYSIDDRDAQSKVTFTIILQLSRLDLRRRPPGGGPLLTLPVGR